MITIMELLSHPVFQEFKLASGKNGLYNPVLGTGIFEWESPEDIERNFSEGEFVVTTLSCTKANLAAGEECLKMLINRKVSGIGIKSVYFTDVSEELKAYADLNRVPVFFFSSTFFDDIIFTIKNALNSKDGMEEHRSKLDLICQFSSDSELVTRKTKELNPFLYGNFICGFISGDGEDFLWKNNVSVDSMNLVFTKVPYKGGFLIIYSAKNMPLDMKSNFLLLVSEMGMKEGEGWLGLSNPHSGLENMGIAIKESMYANLSCRIDRRPLLDFQSTGMDQLLMPVSEDPWVKKYLQGFYAKMMLHDEVNHANLMDTLVLYVKNGGDVRMTAEKSHQHPNTIRYRLEKVKKILGIEKDVDFYSQILAFVRLFEISRQKESEL